MNHRQLLHSFDALDPQFVEIETLAKLCTCEKSPNNYDGIRAAIRGNEIKAVAAGRAVEGMHANQRKAELEAAKPKPVPQPPKPKAKVPKT